MTVSYTYAVEAYISAAWVDITRDVLRGDPIQATRGIQGYSIIDRVATPGLFACTLDNSESNSAATLGYYSPEHDDMRANFGRDTRIRLKITYSGTDYYKYHGWIDDLKPTPGQFLERKSFLTAFDFMQKMAKEKLSLISVQQNQRGDQLMQTVLDNMDTAPLNSSLTADTFELELGLFGEQDERSTPMSAAQKICMTTLGYAFVRGNTTDGETFIYQKESERANQASIATFSDTMSTLDISSSVERRVNKLIGQYHPLRIDPEPDALLAELAADLPIDAGETITFEMRFRDPAGKSVRISALDVVTDLEADEHYKMSAYRDSGGNDMNDYLGLTVTAGGNSLHVSAENTGSVRGFLNKLDIYGRGIYLYEALSVTVESGAADKEQTVDFYYLSDYFRCKSFTEALQSRSSTEFPEVDSVSFYADANATLMGYAMSLDIGYRVTLEETATGLSHPYTVNQITYAIEPDQRLRVDMLLEYAGVYPDYFTLDDVTKGVLDSAYVLSPF